MFPLRNPIRPYAWGSRTAIATLQGRPSPADGPEAELWIGAHPSAPSVLPSGVSLLDAISADPAGLLGNEVVDGFGPRLPYLLKLLAAAEPLSLQAHPDADQAAAGFAAAEASGVDRDAPHRVYVDPFHKPELLVATGEFSALCGFRPPAESAEVLESFGVARLAPVVAALRSGSKSGPEPGSGSGAALRAATRALISWPAADQDALIGEVAKRAQTAGAFADDRALAADLSARYPTDMGVLVALLLNPVRLVAGEAVWMPAGHLHGYLSGLGVEIMAASDNVVRGGLTPKHIDVPELLRVIRFEVYDDPVVRPLSLAPGVVTWHVPAAEFRLVRASCERRGRR